MSHQLKVACLQVNAGPNVKDNLTIIEPMIHEAKALGANFIALPENACCMTSGHDNLWAQSFEASQHPALRFFSHAARETNAWILAGSLSVIVRKDRLANRSYLFDNKGDVAAYYDKIHMFDASLSEQEKYKESANFESGNRAVLVPTPWGKIGLTICYDVRFPALYNKLAKAGAVIIAVPAAFTETTGTQHWHVLLRARAIETGCFIVAPAQCGTHTNHRKTYGHSLVVAPSGQIVSEAQIEPTIITADLDIHKVAEARSKLPTLNHEREFDLV